MALRADRRFLPATEPAPEGEPSKHAAGPNLFAPVSTANRITGQSRQSRLHTREQHLREQLTTGSSYDYGRVTEEPFPIAPAFSADAYTASFATGAYTAAFERVPPTFLRRTMLEPDEAGVLPSPFSYGLAHMTAPEALQEAYRDGGFSSRPDFAAEAERLADPPEAAVYVSGVPLPQPALTVNRHAPLNEPRAGGDEATQTRRWSRPAPMGAARDADQPAAQGDATPYDGLPPPNDYAHPATDGGFPTFDGYSPPEVFAPADGTSDAPQPARRARARQPESRAAQPDAPFLLYGDMAQASEAPPANGYVPRHGGRAAQAAPPPASPVPAPMPAGDVWQMMGWKETQPSDFENTAVWRLSDYSMFERAVFDEPLDPLRNPSAAPPVYGAAFGAPTAAPAQAVGGAGAYGNGQPGERYAPARAEPYAGKPPEKYTAAQGEYRATMPPEAPPAAPPPYAWDSQPYPADASENAGVRGQWSDAHRPPRTPQDKPPPREGRVRATFGRLTPGRAILYTALLLALLFCLIEGAKIVHSLWAEEQKRDDYATQYGQQMGAGDPKAISGVELPPQGVTFAPAATTAAPATATPTPRIPQNDPLVGVVDSGGAKPSSVLPTPTPVLRSKRQRYANNALLTENPAFDALRQENKQVVGRLTIDGVLDETVVQYNNTFYLNHNARGVLSATGAVFVDEGCTLKKPPENLLLRAQANAAGKLFSPLLQYETGGTAFLTQHGIVRCDTLYEDAQYVIFAILRADSVVGSADYFNYAGYPTFPSDTLMMNYVAAAKAKSLIKVSVGVRPDDRLLTLATVPEGGDTTSLVILCRMLRTGESAAYVAPE